jgi:hypothetical protein
VEQLLHLSEYLFFIQRHFLGWHWAVLWRSTTTKSRYTISNFSRIFYDQYEDSTVVNLFSDVIVPLRLRLAWNAYVYVRELDLRLTYFPTEKKLLFVSFCDFKEVFLMKIAARRVCFLGSSIFRSTIAHGFVRYDMSGC